MNSIEANNAHRAHSTKPIRNVLWASITCVCVCRATSIARPRIVQPNELLMPRKLRAKKPTGLGRRTDLQLNRRFPNRIVAHWVARFINEFVFEHHMEWQSQPTRIGNCRLTQKKRWQWSPLYFNANTESHLLFCYVHSSSELSQNGASIYMDMTISL